MLCILKSNSLCINELHNLEIYYITDLCYGHNMTHVYVHENVTVALSCNHNVAVWWGPNPRNLTAYVSGGRLDLNLPHYTRLSFEYNQTDNTIILLIHKFSKKDEGLYRCTYIENGIVMKKEETVLIKSK